jgi:energy-coupling factor transporter ATP-binding protein EcfA2
MEISQIRLERFKKVRDVTIDISSINILVGGNNSGKSSVLEGLHFSVVASVAARLADTKTFTQDSLLFCPTKEFVNLRNGAPYRNQSNFGYLRVLATDVDDDLDCTIKIYRGRNEGNVGCEVTGSVLLRQVVSSSQRPFSVYVPGLSGIPQVEECRTESIVRRGVASGDANLYLRNVLLLIKASGKLQELIEAVKVIFPEFHISVEFNPKSDLHIAVNVSLTGPYGRKSPLELVGTGVQQALQIFSYVVLFKPYLLLLDEPDSHLHPDNQGLLSKALLSITSTTDTKVIISTHSRHLVDALYDESNIVWLKDGGIHQQGDGVGRIPLLMDLGALDSFEKIREGEVDWVFLTEDASLELVKIIIKESGFAEDEVVTYSYKTSSNIQSALALADFISEIAPETKVIIHRDRDFMTDEEIEWIEELIESCSAIPFITEGSDIEYYFQTSEHLSELLDVEVEEIDAWKDEIANNSHNTLVHKFLRKRDELKNLYRNRDKEPPNSMDLLGPDMPLPEEKRLGKFMLRKLRGEMHNKFGTTIDVKTDSLYLWSEKLFNLREDNIK